MRLVRSLLLSLVAAATTIACVEPGPEDELAEGTGAAALEGVYTLYMSPTGSDGNDGLSSTVLGPGRGPVKTLDRVHRILLERRPADVDIEVRIAQGTYHGQTVDWTYTAPGHSISFMPIDYQPGDTLADLAGRPVFTGGVDLGATDDWFFELRAATGQPTKLRFYFLKIQKYVLGGITFRGASDRSDTGWNGFNEVRGCHFYRIGNKSVVPTPAGMGYGAVDLVNSRYNLIEDNLFEYIRNEDATASHIHAIYVAHASHYNRAIDNRYYKINGDPIKVRDYSNFNVFDGPDTDDDYVLTGRTAFYQDWYCLDHDLGSSCPETTSSACTKQECPSYENRFRYNELRCGHDGGDLRTFRYWPENAACRPSWCPTPDPTWTRLHTYANTKNCP